MGCHEACGERASEVHGTARAPALEDAGNPEDRQAPRAEEVKGGTLWDENQTGTHAPAGQMAPTGPVRRIGSRHEIR